MPSKKHCLNLTEQRLIMPYTRHWQTSMIKLQSTMLYYYLMDMIHRDFWLELEYGWCCKCSSTEKCCNNMHRTWQWNRCWPPYWACNKDWRIYRYARSAEDLTNLYEQIDTVLNNNYSDTNGDGKVDSILLADSGFSIATDTLPFINIRIRDTEGVHRDGQCYGMASLTQLYYLGKLPYSYGDVPKHNYGMPWAGSLSSKAYDLHTQSSLKEWRLYSEFGVIK